MMLLASFSSGAIIYGSCIILYYGACKFLVAFCKDFKQRVEASNRSFVRSNQIEMDDNACAQLKHAFSQLIQFHCDTKTLADQSSTIYNPVVAAFIITGGLFTGTNIFELHLVKHIVFLFVNAPFCSDLSQIRTFGCTSRASKKAISWI